MLTLIEVGHHDACIVLSFTGVQHQAETSPVGHGDTENESTVRLNSGAIQRKEVANERISVVIDRIAVEVSLFIVLQSDTKLVEGVGVHVVQRELVVDRRVQAQVPKCQRQRVGTISVNALLLVKIISRPHVADIKRKFQSGR